MDAHIGTEIAGFRIESVLARGGMGVVYIAEQSSPKRKVALKLLAPELASDPAFRQRFIHESDTAASTEHPNIVPIYAAGESDGLLYIAMRYVEGTDLRALIDEEGALPLERVTGIVSQVAAALDAAHARGLVHRDVKPGNVLLAKGSVGPDVAYLCDFGLIRRTEVRTGVTKTGQFMGSVDYCPRQSGQFRHMDAVTFIYPARYDLAQENDIALLLRYGYIEVLHAGQVLGQLHHLVIVCGEKGLRAQAVVVMDVFDYSTGNGQAVISAGAPAYLIEDK